MNILYILHTLLAVKFKLCTFLKLRITCSLKYLFIDLEWDENPQKKPTKTCFIDICQSKINSYRCNCFR